MRGMGQSTELRPEVGPKRAETYDTVANMTHRASGLFG